MPYPYDIGSSAFVPYNLGRGPVYRSGGNLYVLLNEYSNPTQTIRMCKSSDAGLTWAEADGGNHPTAAFGPGNGVGTPSFDDGTRIWIAYLPAGTASAVKAFNTSTDLWETSITGGPTPVDVSSGYGTNNPHKQLGLIVRSNGDKIVLFSKQTTMFAVNYNSLHFQVYNGSTWSADKDILVAGSQETGSGTDYSYDLLGATLGASDRIHAWAYTSRGYAYITVLSDDTTANYRRLDMDSLASPTVGTRNGVWGAPANIMFGLTQFSALPVAWKSDINGVSAQFVPGLLLVEDSTAPSSVQMQVFPEPFRLAANYNSVAVAYDLSTGSTYLIWTSGATGANYQTTIKIACTKGFAWSAPSTLYQSGSNELIEVMEGSAASGTIRLLFQNEAGNSPFSSAHYYQASVSCGAVGCPGGEGNINSVA